MGETFSRNVKCRIIEAYQWFSQVMAQSDGWPTVTQKLQASHNHPKAVPLCQKVTQGRALRVRAKVRSHQCPTPAVPSSRCLGKDKRVSCLCILPASGNLELSSFLSQKLYLESLLFHEFFLLLFEPISTFDIKEHPVTRSFTVRYEHVLLLLLKAVMRLMKPQHGGSPSSRMEKIYCI